VALRFPPQSKTLARSLVPVPNARPKLEVETSHEPPARNADFSPQPVPCFRPLPAEAGVPVRGPNVPPNLEVDAPFRIAARFAFR